MQTYHSVRGWTTRPRQATPKKPANIPQPRRTRKWPQPQQGVRFTVHVHRTETEVQVSRGGGGSRECFKNLNAIAEKVRVNHARNRAMRTRCGFLFVTFAPPLVIANRNVRDSREKMFLRRSLQCCLELPFTNLRVHPTNARAVFLSGSLSLSLPPHIIIYECNPHLSRQT